MEWHIITGEYPPQPGGVSDYTYLLAEALADAGEDVHIWSPSKYRTACASLRIEVHPLPSYFGIRWLFALQRGLAKCSMRERILLVQYVPHMYGWKSMNLAFCCWLALQHKAKFWVMFHEVAFPFRKGQPWKHHILALVHRLMAWIILRSASRSFTSTDAYRHLLTRLAPSASVDILRIFSNVPFTRSADLTNRLKLQERPGGPVVGVFSSFGDQICQLLETTLPTLLDKSGLRVLLIGPGHGFINRFSERFPMFEDRVRTIGRVNALEAGPYFQSCDVLLQLYPEGASLAHGTFVAALASGVPVITTHGSSTGPLLETSGAVAFSDPRPRAIRETILNLLADPAAAHQLGAAGRRLYDNHFDIGVTLAVLSGGRLTAETLARSA